MQGEMQTAFTAAAGDRDKANADLDAIAARYQPQADAFAGEVEAFLASQISSMPAEAQAQMGPMIRAQVSGIPAMVKARTLEGAAAPTGPGSAE